MHRKSKKVLGALCAFALAVAICLPVVQAGLLRIDWYVTGTGVGQPFTEAQDSRRYSIDVAAQDKSTSNLFGYNYKYFDGGYGKIYATGKYYSMSLYNPWGNFVAY